VAKYCGLQPLEARARFYPKLLNHLATSRLVGVQRLRLAITAIQRKHQLATEALLPRSFCDDRPQLAKERGVVAEAQAGVAGIRAGGHAEVLQTPGLGLRKWLVRKVRERRPTPQLEGTLQPFPCCVYVAGIKRAAAIFRQPLEPPRIEGVVLYPQLVTARRGQQDPAGRPRNPVWLEFPTQLRDEHL
jgi:hypothetical protein